MCWTKNLRDPGGGDYSIYTIKDIKINVKKKNLSVAFGSYFANKISLVSI